MCHTEYMKHSYVVICFVKKQCLENWSFNYATPLVACPELPDSNRACGTSEAFGNIKFSSCVQVARQALRRYGEKTGLVSYISSLFSHFFSFLLFSVFPTSSFLPRFDG